MIKDVLIRLESNVPDFSIYEPDFREHLKGLSYVELSLLETLLKCAYDYAREERKAKALKEIHDL